MPDPDAPTGSIASGGLVIRGPVKPESRWPAAVAILAAVAVHLALPSSLVPGPRWLVPVIELALLVALMIANPSTLSTETRDLRRVSIALIVVLNIATIFSLGSLIRILVFGNVSDGRELIRAGFGLWLTLMLGFGLSYWELDRGGPLVRNSGSGGLPDFLFPQMSVPEDALEPWGPRFTDYLYVALTNGTAFSPTDALPLTGRAKLLMAIHSLSSFVTIVIVGARAVNILR